MTILEPLSKMAKDLRVAAATLSRDEARFLVDAYYAMQEDRIRDDHQLRQLTANDEPATVLERATSSETPSHEERAKMSETPKPAERASICETPLGVSARRRSAMESMSLGLAAARAILRR